MLGPSVHRFVEHQAATRGDALAYVDGAAALTYRDLNWRANALARALIAHGLRRGSLVAVRMAPSAELIVTLLGVLKAGGAYIWVTNDASWPTGVSLVQAVRGAEDKALAVDVSRVFTEEPRPCPNLPILTRPSDVACVLGEVLVPHATITGLRDREVPSDVEWPKGGALDMWLALMSGATLTCTRPRFDTVAA
jgi:hypothetical protein